MKYQKPPRPSYEMQDEDLILRERDDLSVVYNARFSGMLKRWPAILEVDSIPYAFAGQEALAGDDAGLYAGRAKYVKRVMSGH